MLRTLYQPSSCAIGRTSTVCAISSNGAVEPVHRARPSGCRACAANGTEVIAQPLRPAEELEEFHGVRGQPVTSRASSSSIGSVPLRRR